MKLAVAEYIILQRETTRPTPLSTFFVFSSSSLRMHKNLGWKREKGSKREREREREREKEKERETISVAIAQR
jgi:hypothetical protein